VASCCKAIRQQERDARRDEAHHMHDTLVAMTSHRAAASCFGAKTSHLHHEVFLHHSDNAQLMTTAFAFSLFEAFLSMRLLTMKQLYGCCNESGCNM